MGPERRGAGARSWRGSAVAVALFAAIILFIGLLVGGLRVADDQESAAAAGRHTHEVIGATARFLSAMQDAEIGQRGYLLTRREAYLEPYDTGARAAPAILATLERLTGDDPGQQARIRALDAGARAYLSLLGQSIASARAGDEAGALALFGGDDGKRRMDALRRGVAQVLDEEQRQLTLRGAASQAARRAASVLIQTLAGLGIVLALACAGAATAAMRAFARVRDSRDFLQTVIESSIDAIFVKDREGRYLVVNTPVAELHGLRPDQILGKRILDLVSASEAEPFIASESRVMETGRAEMVEEYIARDGARPRLLMTAKSPWRIGERVVGLIGIARDITRRKATEDALEMANALLKTQMEAFPGGIALVDAHMKITSHNQKFLDMWNIPAPDGRPDWDQRAFERVRSTVKELEPFRARARYLYDNPAEVSHDDIELQDGRIIDRYTVAIRTAAGAYLGRMWFFRDVTEHRAALAEAQRLARRDVLTGLANRAVFMEALRQSIAKARRSGRSFAVIYLDIDHFKDVNDTLGHGVGDEVLKGVAERLRTHMRETDTVARLGGDEFALIAADLHTPRDVEVLSAKLVELTAEPFLVGARRIQVGASLGIALYEPQASDAETLLSHADQALYQAKAAGRGRSRFFTLPRDAAAASARH